VHPPTENIIVYAANCKSTGSNQVAISLISEFSREKEWSNRINLVVSQQIDDGLRRMNADVSCFRRYVIQETNIVTSVFPGLDVMMNDSKLFVAIFGPIYFFRIKLPLISGFAQAWILYPKGEAWKKLALKDKILFKIKYVVQKQFFLRAEAFVVEHENVRDTFCECFQVSTNRVYVARNCASAIYVDQSLWLKINLPPRTRKFRIGYLGKAYAHKNLEILPDLISNLRSDYNIGVEILVTLDEKEWQAAPQELRDTCVNIGQLQPAQCPNFYREVDAVIAPSLLECVSASPLEGMVMRRPVIAADMSFNRTVYLDNIFYYKPLDAKNCASVCFHVLTMNQEIKKQLLDRAEKFADEFSSAASRAQSYKKAIQCFAEDNFLKRDAI